jgi:NAD-dependent SIR2 family protein deacetylase
MDERIAQAADAICRAEVLVVTAGAGMGVDSGLPDFRGDKGFWNAYPMYERLGLSFVEAANPTHFVRDAAFGWGFYGHRTNLYRRTVPHHGFTLLQEWAERFGLETFVVTSNVDGQFQKAGFPEDSILEVHGTIHSRQCTVPCGDEIWPCNEEVAVDEGTMRAIDIPRCIRCGAVARPNILMFGDWSWNPRRTRLQEMNFDRFISVHRESRTVVVEIGAGTAVPTIRYMSEELGKSSTVKVIRINPREPHISRPHLSIPCGALEGLQLIDALLP